VTLSKAASFALMIAIMLASFDARLGSQAMTVSTKDGQLRAQAPGFHFITGMPIARLKDGLTVRVEMEMRVLAGPTAANAAAQAKQIFVLSYDLWEERFAATVSGSTARSASHLTAAAAEAWCIEQLAVPVSALGSLAKQQFWIRLEAQILNGEPAAKDSEGLTLKGIIDTLSRRQASEKTARTIEGGPFEIRP